MVDGSLHRMQAETPRPMLSHKSVQSHVTQSKATHRAQATAQKQAGPPLRMLAACPIKRFHRGQCHTIGKFAEQF